MSEINAALGLAQLKKLPADVAHRNRLARHYHETLQNIPGLHIPFSQFVGTSSYYIFPIFVDGNKRDRLMCRLRDCGIHTSIHYPPVHTFKHYHRPDLSLPATEHIASGSLSLPIYYRLSFRQIDYIASAIHDSISD